MAQVETPAFVFSADRLACAVANLRAGLGDTQVELLYSIKACSAPVVLGTLQPLVDGFAVASPAEAEIASQFAQRQQAVHLTSPGLRASWIQDLPDVTHIAFNSISQLERLRHLLQPTASLGIRVNPGCSSIDDPRHDPARRHSKLGVSINELERFVESGFAAGIEGLHVHNSYLSGSFEPLLTTTMHLIDRLQPFLSELTWINLGGGYLWNADSDFAPFAEAVALWTKKHRLRVFFEPGAGLVRGAGMLVATVIDLFTSDGKQVPVLDTSVNHLPQVFEYQSSPEVLEHVEGGAYEYILAGCSCLAGDIFGEYTFAQRLELGARVTFVNVGAYSLVKAHRFNGLDLPHVYFCNTSGELLPTKDVSDKDYASLGTAGCQTKISPLSETDKSPEY